MRVCCVLACMGTCIACACAWLHGRMCTSVCLYECVHAWFMSMHLRVSVCPCEHAHARLRARLHRLACLHGLLMRARALGACTLLRPCAAHTPTHTPA